MTKRNLIFIIILVVAVAFIAIGVYRGEVAMVLLKGTKICLECVGLA